MHQIRKSLAATLIAFVAAPAIAAAWPRHAGLDSTYPNAARLCDLVATGAAPKRLSASKAEVTTACARLQTGFNAARTAYATATAPLRRQAFAVIRQYVQICHQDRLSHDPAACRPARQAAVATLSTLRAEARGPAKSYRSAVNAARQTFWAAIRALRGGTSVTADSAVAGGPASPIPPNSAIPSA